MPIQRTFTIALSAALLLVAITGCSDSDISGAAVIDESLKSTTEVSGKMSLDNPFGDPVGTEYEKHIVDKQQFYKEVAKGVSNTPNIPLKPGLYAGMIDDTASSAYWVDGVAYAGHIYLVINDNGTFDYYESLKRVGEDDMAIRGVHGRYSVKGFTLRTSNVKGHLTLLPPGNTFVVNSLNVGNDMRKDFPEQHIDWAKTKAGELVAHLLRKDLGLTEMIGDDLPKSETALIDNLQFDDRFSNDADFRNAVISRPYDDPLIL
ncbi:hypothetical protein NCG89_02935 [Spongiibacter taiwanensis]|uniref:hypothetical protein n=1 Tax=Spongiibacter taiwanensis TaxID=1748242 RepID=UPI002035A33C|nr:hypothetical protein [Spongiibacter taiwanensis]USA43751.1 hypothetical protein NCG89_02935 [Spongiibacter taiwanensis]